MIHPENPVDTPRVVSQTCGYAREGGPFVAGHVDDRHVAGRVHHAQLQAIGARRGNVLAALGEAAGVACAHQQLDEHSQHCPRCGGLLDSRVTVRFAPALVAVAAAVLSAGCSSANCFARRRLT